MKSPASADTVRLRLAAALLVALAAPCTRAANLTWDSSGIGGAAPVGGAGTWNTSNTNWSNGTTNVSWNNANGDNATFAGTAGTVTLGANITVNNLTISTASYVIGNTSAFTLTINGTVTNSVTATLSSPVSGSGFSKTGAGTLVLNAANVYSGNTSVLQGILQTRSTGALPSSTTVILGSGSSNTTLDVRANQTIAGIGTAGTGTASISQSQTTGVTTLTINSDGATAPADSTFGGLIRDGDATHNLALTKAGSRTLTLTGSNNYTGNTTINGGTLQLGNGGATGSLSASSAITNNATLSINRSNTVTQGTDFSSSAIKGTGAFVQAGSGTTILNVANTYSGNTTISAGALRFNADLPNSAFVNVAGGSLTSGAASVSFGGNVTMSSGSISPGGVGTVASFTLGAGKGFSVTGGSLQFDLDTAFDQITGSSGGALSIANATLSLNLLSGFNYASTYALFSGFSPASISGLTITGYDNASWTATLGTDGVLSFAAVPEPSAFAGLAGLGALACAAARRRRSA